MDQASTHTTGVFISFEGVDGCGKSTQIERLGQDILASQRELVNVREPGGTPISEKIRDLLLDPINQEMYAECELLLYEASRAQLTRQLIEPALKRGAVVVCDRYYDSTFAYQSGGRGLDAELIQKANELGSCGFVPDLTIILDIDPEVAYTRATKNGADRIERAGLEFQQRVRAAYLKLAECESERMRVIDASTTKDAIYEQVRAAVLPFGCLG